MERLRSGIDSNALTALQLAWGSSHDALLGLLLWQFEFPSYSFSRYAVQFDLFR